MGDMSLKPGPMSWARWGIYPNYALTRKLKINVCLAFLMHHNRYWSDLIWGIGVWMGEGPYNYAPYMGQSTKSIGQIPHHSPISARWGRWGIPLSGALGRQAGCSLYTISIDTAATVQLVNRIHQNSSNSA